MPEYIRALIVILGLSVPVFYLAKNPLIESFMSLEQFNRRRNLWVGITLAGFLSQNYWVFVAIVCLLVSISAKKETNRVALFFFVCLALPQIRVEIPGMAGIRYILAVDYLRIITLILLLPVCLEERNKAVKAKTKTTTTPDLILGAYLTYLLLLDFQNNSLTGNIRLALSQLIDIVIPYYAISRHIKSLTQFKDVLSSFCVAAMLVAFVGVFEISRNWILYATAGNALDVAWDPGYLVRGDYIRALGTSGQAIVFGYVLSIAIAIYISLSEDFTKKKNFIFGFALLGGGIVASLSKGPWVGLVVACVVLLFTSKKPGEYLTKSVLGLVVFVIFAVTTDYGGKIISYLPFVGDLDEGSTTYRQQLFDKSLEVIGENPFFGSTNYRGEMEELRTGLGIVDLVNTFLVVALNSGLIGLVLFVLFFLSNGVFLLKNILKREISIHEKNIGRGLLAALIGIMVMIGAVSPIYHVPFFMWSIAAMSVAYRRMAVRQF